MRACGIRQNSLLGASGIVTGAGRGGELLQLQIFQMLLLPFGVLLPDITMFLDLGRFPAGQGHGPLRTGHGLLLLPHLLLGLPYGLEAFLFPGGQCPQGGPEIRDLFQRKGRSHDGGVTPLLVDMHGGDLHESMHPLVFIPGVAGEQVTSRAREAAQVLDVDVRVLSSATTGAYNSAALRGVPSLLIERGGNGVWSRAEVDAYKRDIRALLAHLQLLAPLAGLPHREQREIRDAVYLTAKDQGCWYPDVTPGAPVSRGETLGTVCDIFGRVIDCYRAEKDGIVLYMTVSLAVKAGTPLVAYG